MGCSASSYQAYWYVNVILLAAISGNILALGPVVTLTHGGKLEGKTFQYLGSQIDLFLGVRFAEPPINELRFQKPQMVKPWSGVKDATGPSNMCVQPSDDSPEGVAGDEDCLMLDVTIPGGVQSSHKKPVMVWIFGGAFVVGGSILYPAAPLAMTGDVIVVTVNYRLGIFGFLSNGPGTGNLALWDQHMSIKWVKENIQNFGGDPNMITIFGESAGAASVSAQTIGQHNSGLFQRAIIQSGALYSAWSWYLSDHRREFVNSKIKSHLKCEKDIDVFECVKDKTVSELISAHSPDGVNFDWKPVPDRDFFSVDVVDESYLLSQRFDILAGSNGQEEGFLVHGLPLSSLAAGVSTEEVQRMLNELICPKWLLLEESAKTCGYLLTDLYEIENATNDKDRLVRLGKALGESFFNAPVMKLLASHSSQDGGSTYGYYFTEILKLSSSSSELPDWFVKSADHAHDIPYVFGGPYIANNTIQLKAYGILGKLEQLQDMELRFILGALESQAKFSNDMMKLWTNFARTGNPNKPNRVQGFPEWPKFTSNSSTKLMELNSRSSRVIDVPNLQRSKVINNVLYADIRHQMVLRNAALDRMTPTTIDQCNSSNRPDARYQSVHQAVIQISTLSLLRLYSWVM